MYPAGGLPFHQETAWLREEQGKTTQLLSGYATRFTDFLDIALEHLAGDAHVRMAQLGLLTSTLVPNPARSETGVAENMPDSRIGAFAPPQSPRSEPTKVSSMQAPAQRTGITQASPPSQKWQDLEIVFLSDDRVQIYRKKKASETLNYAEFGFNNKKTGTPNMAWLALRRFAMREGIVRDGTEASDTWANFEKRVQEIRGCSGNTSTMPPTLSFLLKNSAIELNSRFAAVPLLRDKANFRQAIHKSPQNS